MSRFLFPTVAGVLSQNKQEVRDFSPETDIVWHSLFWAEGSNFQALGYVDDEVITIWPNETAENDMNDSSNVKYVAAEANLNSRPAVTPSGASPYVQTTSFVSPLDYATAGISIVVVCYHRTQTTWLVASPSTDGNMHNLEIHGSPTATWKVWRGSLSSTSVVVNPNTAYYALNITGTNSVVVNGATATASGGNNTLEGVRMWGNTDSDTSIAFMGLYEGDIRLNSNYSLLNSWVSSHYGIATT